MPTEQENTIRVTEYLDLDVELEKWFCNRCGYELGPARQSYKRGCLLHDRDPREIHPPLVSGEFNFSPDPMWVRMVEIYCPSCGVQIETEYLPPGHQLTWDIEIDLDRLKQRLKTGEYKIRKQRIEVSE
jgi:acetone carboxylase, gamma subunit